MIRVAWPLLLALAACSGRDEELPDPRPEGGHAGPVEGGTLHYSFADDVRSLDPAIAYDEFSYDTERLVFDGLLEYAPATTGHPLELRPQLAESYTVSPDGLQYDFTLRQGITYADGQPIVADDFVFAIERVLDPRTGSPGRQFYSGIDGADTPDAAGHVRGLTAPDERHLRVRLTEPDPSFAMAMAMSFVAPYQRAWFARQGARMRDTPEVSGPFLLDSWLQGSRMVFRRNPRYWNARDIHLDKIVIDMPVDRDTAVLNFLRGDYDTVDRLSSDMYVRFARSPKWKPYIIVSPSMNSYGELMSEKCDPRLNKQVRLAFNYALDKDDSRILSNGRYIVAHGIYPPGLPGYDPTLKPYPHDVAKARALMAAGGYPHGFDITYTTLKDELQEKLAESIQSDLADIGVRVHIQLVTFPAYLTAVGRNQLCFAYSAWVMDFPDPWDFIEVKFHSRYVGDTNASNDAAYVNPALDRVLDAARRELDPAKRIALYQQAERILYADPPWIWHYHSTWVEFLQPYVKGYAYHPVYQRDTRYVWLDR